MKTTLSLFSLTLIFFGCSINKPVVYSLKDIESSQVQSTSNIILDIEELIDKRKEKPENRILFNNSQIENLEGRQICINSEKYYKKEPVSRQVTRMLVTHLNKRKSFRKVVMGRKDTADYYVQGNLSGFYGRQGFSKAALAGSQFGLIGALATAGLKTEGRIVFEISDLKIYNKNNQIVKDLGTFRKEYLGEFPVDGYCWCIYNNVNTQLKQYFSDLVATIETEIGNAK